MLVTVNSKSDLDNMINHIKSHDIIAYDTETTGLNTRREKVIGFSVCGKPGESYYLPLLEWSMSTEELLKTSFFDEATRVLNELKGKKIVCHNASFDLRITENYFGIDLLPHLYCDTVLLKHTVDEEPPFGLKEIAMKVQHLIGLNMFEEANKEQVELKEHLKSRGASTTKKCYELYKGDKFIIGKYAAKDTDLTMRIYNLYFRTLKDKNLVDLFFTEVMPLCKNVVIPMEKKGIPVDVKKIEEIKIPLEKDIKLLEDKIQKQLAIEASNYIQDLLDKNYPISNKGKFAQYYCILNNIKLPATPSGKLSITKKTVESIEDKGDRDFLLGVGSISSVQARIIQEQLHFADNPDCKYIINLNSKNQLKDYVFNYLDEEPLSRTKKGMPQFDDDMVQSLVLRYKWASLLSDYNKLNKISNSYVDRILEENENNIWYAKYKQHGTVSGRLSGDAQQLPRPKESNDDVQYSELVLKYTNMIRSFIVAPTGYKLIITDFSSLEPTAFSHASGDDGLRRIFREGLDFYSEIAIKVGNLQGFSSKKTDPNFLKTLNPQKRNQVKAWVLGVPYGMTAFKLSKDLNIEIEDAEDIVDGYMNAFPDLKQMMHDSRTDAKVRGYVKTELGRIRNLPRVKELNSIYGEKLLDFQFRRKLQQYFEKDEIKKMYLDYKNGLNNSINFKIQGMAAHIMNRSGIEIAKGFTSQQLDANIIMQVHDEYVCLVKDEDVEKAKKIIQDCMENTVKISIPLIAKPSVVSNYGEGHE